LTSGVARQTFDRIARLVPPPALRSLALPPASVSVLMMAADSVPPSPTLSDDARRALRQALTTYLADPSRPDELRAALATVAAEARERSILPERLLVALKEQWYALPDVQRTPDVSDQSRLLQRIVSMCIRAYFD
jgi:hypothetical protein